MHKYNFMKNKRENKDLRKKKTYKQKNKDYNGNK